jgi:hypothetical protein
MLERPPELRREVNRPLADRCREPPRPFPPLVFLSVIGMMRPLSTGPIGAVSRGWVQGACLQQIAERGRSRRRAQFCAI